jgi:hypothetical protein
MLNRDAARPYMDVALSKAGHPLALQSRDFFSFLENYHTAYNNRTPAVADKMLVLDGMSSRVKDFCLSFRSLRFATPDRDENDDDEPKSLLEYDADWDPKTEAGRDTVKCLQWDQDHIIPALRRQLTFTGGNFQEDGA